VELYPYSAIYVHGVDRDRFLNFYLHSFCFKGKFLFFIHLPLLAVLPSHAVLSSRRMTAADGLLSVVRELHACDDVLRLSCRCYIKGLDLCRLQSCEGVRGGKRGP
jgi:uncharacterized membrane protein